MTNPAFDQPILTSPVNYSINDYRKDIAEPNPSLKARFVDTAVNAVCLIHKNTPAAWLADQITNDGKVAPEHILLDDLCRPRGQVPPDPVAPFDGGQCDAVVYRVTVRIKRWLYFDSNDQPISGVRESTTDVYGAVGQPSVSAPGTWMLGHVSAPGNGKISAVCRGDTTGAVKPVGVYDIIGDSGNSFISVEGVSVVRADNQPDSCGNPAPRYPPTLPSPGDLITNPVIQITPTLSVPVRVEVKPTVHFNPTVFAPVAIVNVGGIQVKFDLGGFTLTPTYNNSSSTTNNFPNTTNPTSNPTPVSNPSQHVADSVDISEIIKRLEKIDKEVEECCDRYHPFSDLLTSDYDLRVLGEGGSGSYNLPSKSYRVVVQLLGDPILSDEYAGLNAPNVAQLGWGWFKSGGGVMTRHPIDSRIKAFEVPARTDGVFAFTMKRNYNARVTAYFSKK
jgi:hypothetical protein